jgi:hypothetical protein
VNFAPRHLIVHQPDISTVTGTAEPQFEISPQISPRLANQARQREVALKFAVS